jgi:hypothetical protein
MRVRSILWLLAASLLVVVPPRLSAQSPAEAIATAARHFAQQDDITVVTVDFAGER